MTAVDQSIPPPSVVASPVAYTASNRTIHLWAVGAMAEYMLYVAFNALINPIFTIGFGLSPVLVGWAVTLPRISDGLIDPMIGHFSDNTHTRWGRRRPFLLGATLLGTVVMLAMWWPSRQWSTPAQFIWLLIFSVLLFITYGTFNMTHMALGYELSDDYNARSKIMAVRSAYFAAAAVGGGFLYWLTLRPIFDGEVNGVRWLSVGIAAVILVAGLTSVLSVRERFSKVNRQHVRLGQALKETLRVRAFVVILALRFAQTLGSTLYASMAIYIGIYSVCRGDKSVFASLAILPGIVGVVFAFGMVPLAAGFTRIVGKRRGMILCYGLTFISMLVLPLFAAPGHPYWLLAHTLLFLPATAIREMLIQSMMPDVCDLDELENGQRREALFSAVMSFVSKLENSLVLLLGGYLVAYAGFDAKLVQQPQPVLDRIRLFGFGPAMIFSGLAFAISFYVPVTHEMMAQVRQRLDARPSHTESE